jgi:hypothetical protein
MAFRTYRNVQKELSFFSIPTSYSAIARSQPNPRSPMLLPFDGRPRAQASLLDRSSADGHCNFSTFSPRIRVRQPSPAAAKPAEQYLRWGRLQISPLPHDDCLETLQGCTMQSDAAKRLVVEPFTRRQDRLWPRVLACSTLPEAADLSGMELWHSGHC